MNSETSCFQIYLQGKAMLAKKISSANILEKQTNNQTKHTIKNLMIFFCVCIKDIPAIRIVSTHPWLQYRFTRGADIAC